VAPVATVALVETAVAPVAPVALVETAVAPVAEDLAGESVASTANADQAHHLDRFMT